MQTNPELAQWINEAKAAASHLNHRGLNLADTWVSHAHRYFYMGIPKNACSKAKVTLHQLEGYELPENPFEVHARSTPRIPFVASLADIDTTDGVTALTTPDWFRFSFVRNPYTRLLSAYKNQIMDLNSPYIGFRELIRESAGYPTPVGEQPDIVAFRDFVNYIEHQADEDRDGHWRSQSGTLCLDFIDYDFLGRVESFKEDFSRVLDRFLEGESLVGTLAQVLNESPPIPPALAYDGQVAEQVYRMYRKDFETFGYHKDSWRIAK